MSVSVVTRTIFHCTQNLPVVAQELQSACGSYFPGMWDLLSRPGSNPIPCIGRQILNHWPPGKTPNIFLFERKDIRHSKEEIATSLMYSFEIHIHKHIIIHISPFSVSNRYLIFLGLIKYFFSYLTSFSVSIDKNRFISFLSEFMGYEAKESTWIPILSRFRYNTPHEINSVKNWS